MADSVINFIAPKKSLPMAKPTMNDDSSKALFAQTLQGNASWKQSRQRLPYLSSNKSSMSKRVILTQDQSAERNSNLQRPSLAKRFGFENDMNERVSDSSFSTIPNTAIQTYRNTSTAEFGTTKGTDKQKESTIDVVKVMNMTMDQRKQGRWLQMFDNKPKGEN